MLSTKPKILTPSLSNILIPLLTSSRATSWGVKRTAEEFEKEFLGEIPINPEVGKCGDEGKPIVEANPEHEISKIYLDFAKKIKSTYL